MSSSYWRLKNLLSGIMAEEKSQSQESGGNWR